jgi:hypothetical protein
MLAQCPSEGSSGRSRKGPIYCGDFITFARVPSRCLAPETGVAPFSHLPHSYVERSTDESISGGFGVGPVARVLRSFAGAPNVSLTVVCGNNPRLYNRVRCTTDRLGIEARVIGFEPQMPERVAQADVVITKPGGLTVSECLSAGRPLVLVGAVPGQESLNQAWVVEQGAGVASAPEAGGDVIADSAGPASHGSSG